MFSCRLIEKRELPVKAGVGCKMGSCGAVVMVDFNEAPSQFLDNMYVKR